MMTVPRRLSPWGNMRKLTRDRKFWSKVDKLGEYECWEWTSGKKKGYGILDDNNKHLRANRVSYEIHNGPIPECMIVRHSCDNPGCVNPKHLLLGTQADNMKDMTNRGRQLRGDRHRDAKLSEEDVVKIRELTLSGKANSRILSERFGVSQGQICNIVARRKWKHI